MKHKRALNGFSELSFLGFRVPRYWMVKAPSYETVFLFVRSDALIPKDSVIVTASFSTQKYFFDFSPDSCMIIVTVTEDGKRHTLWY